MTLFVAEPPAMYLTKPSAVLDASVLCAMLFSETSAAEAVTHMNAYALHAPQLVSYELANVALKKSNRIGRLKRHSKRSMILRKWIFNCIL